MSVVVSEKVKDGYEVQLLLEEGNLCFAFAGISEIYDRQRYHVPWCKKTCSKSPLMTERVELHDLFCGRAKLKVAVVCGGVGGMANTWSENDM